MKFNIFKPKEVKENPVGQAVFMTTQGKTKSRNASEFVKEGYIKNPIVYKCIDVIASAAASMQIELQIKRGEKFEVVEKHPVIDLLRKPNPNQSGSTFVKNIVIDYLLHGNAFVMQFPETGKALELWAADPVYMEVFGGKKGIVEKYVYNHNIVFKPDQITGKSPLLHLKKHNPLNAFVGLSPLEHAALSVDVHNGGLAWNSALLENGARPSGALVMAGSPSKEQVANLREWITERNTGAQNSGKPLLLYGGMDWKELGLNSKDMDFTATMAAVTKYIASVFGVPLPLVENDAASYNNMEQAQEQLWTNTVLPLLNIILESLGNWLLPQFGQDLRLGYNLDSIPALEAMRARKYERTRSMVASGLLTINEGREALGYSTIESDMANTLLISSGLMPLDMAGDITQPIDPALNKAAMDKIYGK